MAEATTLEQMTQTITTSAEEAKEGQEMSMEQDIQGEEETQEGMDLTANVTQHKRPRVQE